MNKGEVLAIHICSKMGLPMDFQLVASLIKDEGI